MRIPDRFLIKGEEWVVEIKEKVLVGDTDCDGSTDSVERRIELRADLDGKRRDHVALHEFLHAALHELHIHNLEEQEEEVIVDGLAKCLLDNFYLESK